jgi:hypothetical protein
MAAPLSAVIAARTAAWRYAEGGKRDRRLDFLRGYCVFAMAVDHLGANSWLALLTGGNRFFVSAAEGFLFLSGLVMGIVYRPVVARDGLTVSAVRALRRAALIYALTVAATLGFMALSVGLDLPWSEQTDPLAAAPAVLQLRQTFYLTDVLLLYTILIALAPLAFVLLHHRLALALLGLTWGIWGAHQVSPISLPWPSEDDAFFYVAAWQVLFFTGLTIGWHRDRVAPALARVGSWPILAGSAAGLTVLVALWAWASGHLGPVEAATSAQVWDRFAKWNLPPARLIACAVVFAFGFTLVDRCWSPLARAAGRLLLPLGTAALTAYVLHLFVIGLLTALGQWLSDGDTPGRLQTMLLQVGALSAILLGVRLWTERGRYLAGLAARPPGPARGLAARAGIGLVVGWLLLAGATGRTQAAPSPALTPSPPAGQAALSR